MKELLSYLENNAILVGTQIPTDKTKHYEKGDIIVNIGKDS